MSKINDGGPAFPRGCSEANVNSVGRISPAFPGMSLRDWFAGQALPVVIAATSAGQHSPAVRDSDTHISFAIARDAYFMADAMLLARSRQEEDNG